MAIETVDSLGELTSPASGDELGIWDVSAAQYLKITRANLIGATLTGGGTIATGGYTLTLAASGTPAYVNSTTTWTPTLLFGGASTGITYSTQVGRCVRVDNMVALYVGIALSSKGSATGSATISGLPFSAGYVSVLPCRWNNMTSSLVNVSGYVQTSDIAILGITAAATNLNSITDAAFANNSVLIMMGVYLV